MNTFNITINADGRWYGEAFANTPEEAYNKVLSEINIDEPHTTINNCFCEHCEIYPDDKYFYPDDKEFTEINPQNYDVSIVIRIKFNIDIEAETLEKAREKAWDVWVPIEYPSNLSLNEYEIEEDD